MILACRKGGTLSVPGVHAGLTWRMGETHTHRYARRLLERVRAGGLDPSFIFTHEVPLGRAPEAYELFNRKRDGVMRIRLDCRPDRHARFAAAAPARQAAMA